MVDRTDPSKYLKWNIDRKAWIDGILESHIQQFISFCDPRHSISAIHREQARTILKNLLKQSDEVKAYLLTQPLGREIENEVRNTFHSTHKVKSLVDFDETDTIQSRS